jgi:hypothetical protein
MEKRYCGCYAHLHNLLNIKPGPSLASHACCISSQTYWSERASEYDVQIEFDNFSIDLKFIVKCNLWDAR